MAIEVAGEPGSAPPRPASTATPLHTAPNSRSGPSRFSRRCRLSVKLGWSALRACSPGTGSLLSARTRGCPSSWDMPSPCGRCTGAKPRTTASIRTQSRRSGVEALSPQPPSTRAGCVLRVISCAAAIISCTRGPSSTCTARIRPVRINGRRACRVSCIDWGGTRVQPCFQVA